MVEARRLRFLADEHVPRPSVSRLRHAGHDVAFVKEDEAGSSDPIVLSRAVLEQRILLTFDRDYGDLVFHRGHPPPPGIVYFRTRSNDLLDLAFWIIDWLEGDNPPLEGWLTVIQGQKLRRRPLTTA